VRRNLTASLIVGFACATVFLGAGGTAHAEDPDDYGANKTGTGQYTGHSTTNGTSSDTGSNNSGSANLDPNEYICVWVRQVNSEGYEYSEPIPAGQEGSGQHMNQLCGKRSQVRAALGQADPAAYLMDNCDAPCGALYGQYQLNPPTPRELAQMLLTQLNLRAPGTLHTSPDANRLYVRFPTWFWVEGEAGVTEPKSASTSDGAVTITAVPELLWTTGEGDTVSCEGPGTPYSAARFDPADPSPDCGHTYAKPGHYTLTLTVNWTVKGTGPDGDLGEIGTDTFTASEDIDVFEIQGVVTDVR
jgi:hypothetical protein